MQRHTLILGDAARAMAAMKPASVQFVVTSPPYWCIKDYDHPEQIGHQDSYDRYLARLGDVWNEAARVLEPGCKVAINVGDQFLRAKEHGTYRIEPIHADIIKQFQRIGGFIFLGGIIWHHVTTTKTTGGCSWMGSIYHPRDGYVTYEHEFVLLFKKRGVARRPSDEARQQSRLTREQRSAWFRGVWEIPPARQKDHPATFPLELPERLIRMFTFWGEAVLDPFVGSGTTLEAAERTGRVGTGIELNPAFARICERRVQHIDIIGASDARGRPVLSPPQTRIDSHADLSHAARSCPRQPVRHSRPRSPAMSSQSSIEWTEATWNPVTGCTKVSPGCKLCYAERLARRLRLMGQHRYRNGFDLTLHPDLLDLPLRWRRPRVIFVNSMSDLFHKDIPEEYIARAFETMAHASWHTFQVLTKRSERLRDLAPRLPWPRNVWQGVSFESAKYAWRASDLRAVPAAVRFLSVEPLLGPIPDLSLDGIDWVIVGGESGPGARSMRPAWVREIRERCRDAGVPFFFKQWGGINKAATGRVLDGRTWDEMPRSPVINGRSAAVAK